RCWSGLERRSAGPTREWRVAMTAMRDPLDALRQPVVPVDPDPTFAAALRTRLEDLLTDTTTRTTAAPRSVRLRHGDVGYASLWTPDVGRAATFYATVLGWEYESHRGPQGRQVQGVSPTLGMWGGQERGTTFLCFAVRDMAVAREQIVAAGGEAQDPTAEPYGLTAMAVDDQGMPFAIVEQPSTEGEPPPAPRHGELAYLTLEVPDSGRTRAFFGTVLGWRFTPGRVEDGWGVEDVWPMTGLQGGHEHPTVVPMYAVDDLEAAVVRVRAAGGTSSDPEQMPYGITADCADDQGTRFYLGQL
ncbi:MAG: VOC family protein, partial [Acidimicrobiales bacterium]